MTRKHHEKAKSETTTWLTPLPLIRALGTFDVDPCGYQGHKTAQIVICAPEMNGLNCGWHGRVWLNPPYGRGIEKWLSRLRGQEEELWGKTYGTALLPARTETAWFQAAVSAASAALFLEKRISFLRPDGTAVDGNTVGSVLLAYGLYDREKLRNSGLKGWFVAQ